MDEEAVRAFLEMARAAVDYYRHVDDRPLAALIINEAVELVEQAGLELEEAHRKIRILAGQSAKYQGKYEDLAMDVRAALEDAQNA